MQFSYVKWGIKLIQPTGQIKQVSLPLEVFIFLSSVDIFSAAIRK